jgi:hypothetical protein
MASDDRFNYAEYRLTQKQDPEPMRKIVEQLETETRVGQQLVRARELLEDLEEGSKQ